MSNGTEMAKTTVDSLYEAAWQAHRNGRQDDAIALLERAIELTTCETVKSYYLATKGGFLCRNERYTEAIVACTEAVSLKSSNFYALTQRGLAHFKMGDYGSAANSFESAARIRPDPIVLTMLANAQLPIDPSAARASAERALALSPHWEEAKTVLDAARKAQDAQQFPGS